MEVNSPGTMSRTDSTRSSRKSSSSYERASSERSSPLFSLKSPSVGFHYASQNLASHGSPQCIPKSPTSAAPKSPVRSPKSPIFQKVAHPKSEKVFNFGQKCESPTIMKNDKVFEFGEGSSGPKSPRPRTNYGADSPTSPKQHGDVHSPSGNNFSFNIKPPPKPKVNQILNRQQFQSSRNGSSSSKSSLEYVSTTTHPTGDYQSVEYKICNSIDSDSQTSSDFQSYGYKPEAKRRSRHSSIKDKKSEKPACNIRTNPGYDEKYSSSKSINETGKERGQLQRCRKSTSDLTDMTDDAGNTTVTSLSRPSSPRRNGSIKGGLAYLASRRGSRDSVASNMSNVSNEDIGPLNFQNTARGRQRRTSNFLELPGESFKWFFLMTAF